MVSYVAAPVCVPASSPLALQSQTPPLLEGQPLGAANNPTGTSQTSLDGLEIGGETTVVEVRQNALGAASCTPHVTNAQWNLSIVVTV